MDAEVIQLKEVDIGPILIIDDEIDVHEELAEFLFDLGYLAWHALNVDETLDILRKMPEIRILLVDIKMPGRDGLDLIAELRNVYGDYHECIVITGHGSKEHAISGVRLGLADFLEKPLHLPALEAALRGCARRLAWKEARGDRGPTGGTAEGSLYQRVRELRSQLDYLRSHDPLTGFLNRDAFLAKASHRLSNEGQGKEMVVILVDVDRFRQVNELHGFAAGDQVLVAIAGRIEALAGSGAVLGRLSADRFAILRAFDPEAPGPEDWARALRAQLTGPAPASGVRHGLSLTTAAASVDSGLSGVERLVFNAEMALAEGKRLGGDRHVLARKSLVTSESRSNRMLSGIRDALAEGRIQAWYQPIVTLDDGAIWGAEALMRWERGGETVSAGVFAAAVKDTDAAPRLDETMVRTVVSDLAQWRHVVPEGRRRVVSVNLWSRTLLDPGVFDRVMDCLEAFASDRFVLALEITEGDLALVAERQRRRLLGFCEGRDDRLLFLDDFGVAHSSFARLRDFPVDCVKLDRDFTLDLAHSQRSVQLLESIITMARQLGCEVIAEGIETTAQHRQLLKLGCRYGQGYLFGAAMRLEDVLARAAGPREDRRVGP